MYYWYIYELPIYLFFYPQHTFKLFKLSLHAIRYYICICSMQCDIYILSYFICNYLKQSSIWTTWCRKMSFSEAHGRPWLVRLSVRPDYSIWLAVLKKRLIINERFGETLDAGIGPQIASILYRSLSGCLCLQLSIMGNWKPQQGKKIHGKWMSGIEVDDEIYLLDDEQAMCLWSFLLIIEAYVRAHYKASSGLC